MVSSEMYLGKSDISFIEFVRFRTFLSRDISLLMDFCSVDLP